eukprot:241900-Prorocentrum_lima.AAC.1
MWLEESAIRPYWSGLSPPKVFLLDFVEALQHPNRLQRFRGRVPVWLNVILMWSTDIGDRLWPICR